MPGTAGSASQAAKRGSDARGRGGVGAWGAVGARGRRGLAGPPGWAEGITGCGEGNHGVATEGLQEVTGAGYAVAAAKHA
jgi:hypothetical protein